MMLVPSYVKVIVAVGLLAAFGFVSYRAGYDHCEGKHLAVEIDRAQQVVKEVQENATTP